MLRRSTNFDAIAIKTNTLRKTRNKNHVSGKFLQDSNFARHILENNHTVDFDMKVTN